MTRSLSRSLMKSSPDVVKDLVKYGVSFTRDENGDFVYTREGAHAHHRILFHEDITGKGDFTKPPFKCRAKN